MSEDPDPYASVESGVDRQRIIVEGRVASLADGGNPGPHISLRAGGKAELVVHADQVDNLTRELARVRDRIVEVWRDWPQSEKADLEARARDTPRNRARVDQDRALFYDRLAERLDAVATYFSGGPRTSRETVRLLAEVLDLDDSQVLPFVTEVDLVALAGRS
jgi:non-ribosomal peptide synthetase component F